MRRDAVAVTARPLQLVAERDAGVTLLEAPIVTQSVTPTVTHAVTVTESKPSSLQPLEDGMSLPSVTLDPSRRDATPETVRVTVMPPEPVTPNPRIAPVLAIALAAIAIVIAAVGVAINGWFAGNLGRTPEAARLFIAIGICADCLALFLPTAASRLAGTRHYAAAAIAWLLWCATMTFVLLASAGFAGLNVADVTAGRAREVLTGQAVATRMERLQAERAAITEKRSVVALEAELQAAQPAAAAVWKRSNECRDVTMPASAQACAGVLQARQRLGEAQRRDAIDAELRDVETRLVDAPAVSSADPQAVTAAKLVNWVTAGVVTLTTADIGTLRLFLLALLPQCAGLVLMLAGLMWARVPA
jgi:hypothetical protein